MTEFLLVCRPHNDLYRVLCDNGMPCRRFDRPQEATEAAPEGGGVLVLADGYPDEPTRLEAALWASAREKSLRLYAEFPESLPGLEVGAPRGIAWERGVVSSDALSPHLERLRILAIHGCRFVPVDSAQAHLVLAKVAGLDTAVYGLPAETHPILFEHPAGGVLVAATKLSQFVTARYAPAEAWEAVWRWILGWASQREVGRLTWTPSVRPSWGAGDSLPEGWQAEGVKRGVGWMRRARLLIHPSWEAEARRRQIEFADGTGPGPDEDWPLGDGTCGMIEGASSTIHPDGTQNWRYWLRNDCMGEAAMAFAFGGIVSGSNADLAVARNLNDFIYFNSGLAGGRRADPGSPSYGLVAWTPSDPRGGVYYGDDNARSMLGTTASAALLRSTRWDEPLAKCLLGNLRTTGPLGFRGSRLEDDDLQEKGWRSYWATERTNFAPHYEAWLWACSLWAYGRSGFPPFLERARNAIRMTMEAYPSQWRWTNGIQQERARMLLPLAWLVRVDDRPLHREWLAFMACELLAGQDPCGAIREEIGEPGQGQYAPCQSNEEYGKSEAPLIQKNGDPVCDLLYTTNFAFAGLHEAAAATGEARYRRATEKLAEFLCRIQVRSERRPELDGGWFRAFEFSRWDYWASNADLGWGVWSIESGWTQSWISAVLAMREMETSLWELTADSRVGVHLDELAATMLPNA